MPALFAITLFFSAFLLFSVQPMVAKAFLPAFGGTPSVWNTCMVFFQAVLLAGYAYAHALAGRIELRRQLPGHGLVLTLGLAATLLMTALPGLWSATGAVTTYPILWLLGYLAVSVGLPFFAVSATAPLLQRWFAQTGHPSAGDPYFLYGASNLGSMVALLGYPLFLEPNLRLAEQRWLWLVGFIVLVVLLTACGFAVWLASSAKPHSEASQQTPDPSPLIPVRRGRWLALAFVPSSLLYGVTTYLTTDIAAVPLFWVLPLAIYLLTFILVFGRFPLISHTRVLQAFPLVVLGQTFVFAIQDLRPLWLLFALHLATFFMVALACHGELARDRPEPQHLTEFYLWLSAGGVLGGLFNTLAAPLLFAWLAEYPLALVLACFLVPVAGSAFRKPLLDWSDLWLPLFFFLFLVSVLPVLQSQIASLPLRVSLMYGLPAAVGYLFINRPIRFGLGVGAILLAGAVSASESKSQLVYRERGFFGIVRVLDEAEGGQPGTTLRRFIHGSTLHGMQRLNSDPDVRREPLTYYFRNGPIGQVFDVFSGRLTNRVAVVGLGAGTLSSYARPGEHWTYYEIDPTVERVARNYFTYLGDSEERGAEYDIVFGDGRLGLAKAEPHIFSMIFADAFSSDAVPVHLLTREALQQYLERLSHGGVLVVNITNRGLDLEPVLANLAEDAGLAARLREENAEDIGAEDKRKGKTASRWVVLARKEADLAALAHDSHWRRLQGRQDVGVWTDDYSNLVSVIRWKAK